MPDRLPISHILVRDAQAAFRRLAHQKPRKPSVLWRERYQAQLLKPGAGYLDISVSRPLVRRALRIMQALIEALEARGYVISIAANNETIVSVLNEPFQIDLNERLTQVTTQGSYGPSMDLKPSGCLRLRIGGSYGSGGVADAPQRPIEGALNRFIGALVRRALETKRQRAIREEREARWRVYDDERRRNQQVRQTEILRHRHLRKLASRWASQQRLRLFIEAAEQRLRDGVAEGPQAAAESLAWARQYLVAHDALQTFFGDEWPSAPVPAASGMPWNWE